MAVRRGEDACSGQGELARCAWCGGPAVPDGSGLAVCRCCGVATTYPRPTAEELEQAYMGWYRPAAGRFSAGGDRLLSAARARLARRVDDISPPGPILDVGAGEGTLIRALRARGRTALGLERAGGADGVIAAEITHFDQGIGEWAAVILWHTLEHLPDSAGAVDRAKALLAPGGVIVLAVPNLESWQARLFGAHWFHLDLPRHLVHLRASALRQGLEARGLHVERVSHWRGGQRAFGWMQGFVGLLPGHPNLYDAIRRPGARSRPMSAGQRVLAVLGASVLSPVGAVLATAESAFGAGGTVYIEARKR